MLKQLASHVWAFDLEWVPDPRAGRLVYGLPENLPDAEVIAEMWQRGGATAEDPQPYLKTVLCRVVSVAVVIRKQGDDGEVQLDLRSLPLPGDPVLDEATLISRFLNGLGKTPRPQLVGFNSQNADLPILLQRGIACGVTAPGFCARPNKPWEGQDYFVRYGEGHVDLKDLVSGWGKATPSMHELAQVSGIPGKMETSGLDVVTLWLEGKLRAIVEYNQCDALTTYLLWLRTVHFAGLLSAEDYTSEQQRLRELLEGRAVRGEEHVGRYLQRWNELSTTLPTTPR